MTYSSLTKVIGGVGLASLMAFSALADHWNVERMNADVDSYNFKVGNGCSGSLISLQSRLILTNHHCIESYVRVVNRERVIDGTVQEVRVEELRDVIVSQESYAGHRQVGSAAWQSVIVARWKGSDLALLQIRADSIPHTRFAQVFGGDTVYRGETIYVVGNPSGLTASIHKGIVSSVQRMFRFSWTNEDTPFIQIDAGVSGGNSGGSLMNEHGELIGIPAAGIRNQGQLGLAIPFFQIQKFLTDNCYEEVWNLADDVVNHADCMTAKDEEAEADERASVSGATISATTLDGKNDPNKEVYYDLF